jgi:hypothetical protein
MFERLRAWVLRVVRVPPEPEPPLGDPAMTRVFRASRRLYLLRMITWGAGQVAALTGIVFWFGVIFATEYQARKTHAGDSRGQTSMAYGPGKNQLSHGPGDIAGRVPPSAFSWLWIAKGIGLAIYVGQLGITYLAVRLDYELRWYMVTDRSLRIRSGLWTVQEITMSFANIQQVIASQGPLQRLMSIADVRVESAGGGGRAQQEHGRSDSMHTGVFHGVENAAEIRDLILERLRQFRETGLGDPDEKIHEPAQASSPDGEILVAARQVLSEARALRAAFTGQRHAD